MDTVNQFRDELNGIKMGRPPVSRAKMASITKLAMKSHKYYKHIVMLVEKFISKASTEFMIPGLYVIDSIMRQSRHQFGSKESFGPRFTKNFEKTFLHLYQCSEEDKPKIVRVLNLWQRNGVFPSDVIQPLLALASSDVPTENQPTHSEQNQDIPQYDPEPPNDGGDGGGGGGGGGPPQSNSGGPLGPSNNEGGGGPVINPNLDLSTATTIIQQQQEQITALLQQQQQLQSQATSLLAPALSTVLSQQQQQQHQQQQSSGGMQLSDTISSLLQQTQQLQVMHHRLANGDKVGGEMGGVPAQLSNMEQVQHNSQPSIFNEAVLNDFDYSDEEDALDRERNSHLARQKDRESIPPPGPPGPPGPPLLPHDDDSASPSRSSPRRQDRPPEHMFPPNEPPHFQGHEARPHPLHGGPNEGHRFQREMGGVNPPLPPGQDRFSPGPPPGHLNFPPPLPPHNRGPPPPQIPPGPPRDWPHGHPPPPMPPRFPPPPPRSPSPRMRREGRFSPPPPPQLLGRRSPSPPPSHHRAPPPWRERERTSRWSPPPPPRRRSRSPIMRRPSRDRSRSPPPPSQSRWHRPGTPPKNQERRRKGIPYPRDKHMTVCSTTLWVGHLSKLASKEMVKQAFEDFGQIKSVELVQARGCAYLVMMHRNDAIRALNSLRDLKLGGSTCKLAWAPGRGVKGAGLKAFWDQEVGSSYIPWSFVKNQSDVNSMADGGWIDRGTLPPGFTSPPTEEELEEEEETAPTQGTQAETIQPQPPPPPPPPPLTQNIPTSSLPPQQNLPLSAPSPLPPQPLPPPTSFSQLQPPLMDPSQQLPPPRGVPNSHPVSVPQPLPLHIGQPQSGVPQHPLGGEPNIPRPPLPPLPPHSMPPGPLGGVPQHPGIPPYSPQAMHQPHMMTRMAPPPPPPHSHHGMPMGSNPHQMVYSSSGNVPPPRFLPPPPIVSPVSRNFPPIPREPLRPMRPFFPRHGHMAPHMGEVPPRPQFIHQQPPMLSGPNQDRPQATNWSPLRPQMAATRGLILPQEPTEEPEDASMELVPMDEDMEMDEEQPKEEPNELMPTTEDEQSQAETKEPNSPAVNDEPVNDKTKPLEDQTTIPLQTNSVPLQEQAKDNDPELPPQDTITEPVVPLATTQDQDEPNKETLAAPSDKTEPKPTTEDQERNEQDSAEDFEFESSEDDFRTTAAS